MPINELCPDNFRDIRKTLVVQDPVNVFYALLAKLLISLEFLGLLIFYLEFLKPQLYATNASSIKIFAQQLALEQILKLL